MLKRAVRRARLHLPASTVHQDEADQSPPSYPPAASDGHGDVPAVAHARVADDPAMEDHFRRKSLAEQDVAGIKALLDALRLDAQRLSPRKRIESVGDEDQRAAVAWTRLQRLYGLFQATMHEEDDADEYSERSNTSEPSRTRDEGLRTVLEQRRTPDGVMLRDLRVLPEALRSREPPQGFTADVFLSLGDALYAEMVATTRPSRDALQGLGDSLYAEAISQPVVPVSAC